MHCSLKISLCVVLTGLSNLILKLTHSYGIQEIVLPEIQTTVQLESYSIHSSARDPTLGLIPSRPTELWSDPETEDARS